MLPEEKYQFNCVSCSLFTNNKKDFGKHILTAKHLKAIVPDSAQNKPVFKCDCGKVYNHRASLYKHKKCCLIKTTTDLSFAKIDYFLAIVNELQTSFNDLLSRNNELTKRITHLEKSQFLTKTI